MGRIQAGMGDEHHDDDDSLRAIGTRARRRALGWDLSRASEGHREDLDPSRPRRSVWTLPVDASGCEWSGNEAGAVVASGDHRGVALRRVANDPGSEGDDDDTRGFQNKRKRERCCPREPI